MKEWIAPTAIVIFPIAWTALAVGLLFLLPHRWLYAAMIPWIFLNMGVCFLVVLPRAIDRYWGVNDPKN